MNFLVFIDQVFVSGCRVLLSIVIARSLGLEEFGVYSLLWTIVIFSSAMQIPISIIPMMQLAPRMSPKRKGTFNASAMIIQLGYGIVSVLLTVIALILLMPDDKNAIQLTVLISGYIFAYNQFEYLRRYFFSEGKRVAAFFFDVLLYSAVFFFIYLLLVNNIFSLESYIAISLLPAGILSLAMVRLYQLYRASPVLHLAIIRRLLAISSPLIGSTIAHFISGYCFVFSTAYFLGASEVGGISAVRNIVGPFMLILMALENSLIRKFALLPINSNQIRIESRKETVKWLFLFLILALLFSGFSSELMRLLYGEEFVVFSNLIYWFCGTALIQVISRVQTIRLRAQSQFLAIKNANIVTMLVALIISPLLIWFYGVSGAGPSVFLMAFLILVLQDLYDSNGFIKRRLEAIRN